MIRSKKISMGADIEVFVSVADPKKEAKKVPRYLKDMVTIDGTLVSADQTLPLPEDMSIEELTANLDKETIDRKANRKIIPCVGLFPGTKAKPYYPKSWAKGFAIQEDNVMLEFNVPVTYNSHEFISSIKQAKKYVNSICKSKSLQPAWNLTEYKFELKDLDTPQAQLFGCDPDLDAYSGGSTRETIPDFGTYRTCGGHIHMGGDFNCPDFVAVLFLELILILYLGQHGILPQGTQRSKWYGRPGIFRTKEYGIEYRTMSNNWATSPYMLQDVGMLLFKIGNMLVQNPAGTIQQWFRKIEWAKIQELLSTVPPHNDKNKIFTYKQEWQDVRNQYASLLIPGLEL